MHGTSGLMAGLASMVVGLCWPGAVFAQTEAKNSDKLVTVNLRAAATVDEPIVTISAVAAIEGGEQWMRQQIGSLDLAEVSGVGRSVVVSRDQVTLRIELAGFDLKSFRVDGPGQAMVKMNAVELTEHVVVKAAQQAVLQRLKVSPKDVEFRVLEPVRLPAVSLGQNDTLRFAIEYQGTAIPIGKTRIDVGIVVNDQRRGAATVVLDVSPYRDAAVATRRLEAGETLQAGSIRAERRVFHTGDTWVPYTDQLLGKRLLHSIAAGQAIASADFTLPLDENETAIRTRDTVKLVANVGSMRVMTVGEALQDGKIGQLIRVRNIDSGKVITGRVLDRSTVEVEY